MRYLFGEFALDTDAYTLSCSGRSLHLRPKVFELLCFLIERRGRIVTKRELLDALWDAEYVNEAVIPWSISHARRALRQHGDDKGPIETVYSRGYRWRAEVEVVHEHDRVHEPASAASSGTAASAHEPSGLPFVGRSEQMESLRQRLAQAKAGHGGLCLLIGEPGIGKTRCMDEFARGARSSGFSAWSGRASEEHWTPAFWPWTQVLRSAEAERETRDQAAPLLARLGSVPDADSHVELRGEPQREARAGARSGSARFALLDDIGRFLFQASRRKPLLVLLDDLHWADAATIALLTALAPDLRRHALLIVASQRDRPDGPRPRQPSQLARYAERFELQPLTTNDVGQYIGLVVGSSAPDEALCAAVHRATAGNPLFLQETVQTLIAQHGCSGLSALSPADVKPPQLARDVLRERVELLDAGARKVLAAASVLGESFDTELLQAASEEGSEIEPLLIALDACVRAGLLSAESAYRYRFRHALVRNVVYDELSAQARAAAHRRAALALERNAQLVGRNGELAHHYYRSLALGAAGTVTAAAQRAANEAARSGEHEAAAKYCQWALEAQALDLEATPRQRGELLLLRARSARHAGRGDDARAAVVSLVDLARQHGYTDLLVRAARVLRPGRTWGSFNDPVARAALEETLRIAPHELDEQRISALAQLASVTPYARDMARSKTLSEQALAGARKLDNPALLAEALRARLYALSGPDDIDAVRAVAQEMLGLDGDANTWISVAAHSACYGAAIHRGDLPAADHALEALEHSARRQRHPEALWYHERLRAQRRFLEGDVAGAESAFTELQSMRLAFGAWVFRIPQALLAIERQGVPTGAASWDLPGLIARTRELPPEYGVNLARIAVRVGREDLARPVLERVSADDFAGVPKDIGYLNTLVNLGLVAIALGDRVRAECLYGLLAPYPHHNAPTKLLYYEGSVSHYLALLAEFLGERPRAQSHFDDALAMNETLGHRSQLARTYYEYARFLRGSARSTNRSLGRAQQLKGEGVRLAATLGMKALEAQARAL